MSNRVENTVEEEQAANWEARLDELATHFMIKGMSPAILTDLAAMADAAASRQLPSAAEQAGALVKALQTAPKEQVEQLWKEGITRLRASFKQEQSGVAAVTEAYALLGDDAELVNDFLVEAREHLSQIEGQMLLLERDPAAMEVIHTVFRAFHTIKGLAGFLGFAVVQSVAHEVETLLDLARNEKLVVDSAIVDVVLESGDFLLAEMATIDRTLAGGPPQVPADNSALIARIRELAVPTQQAAAALAVPPTESVSSSIPKAAKKKSAKATIQLAVEQPIASAREGEGKATEKPDSDGQAEADGKLDPFSCLAVPTANPAAQSLAPPSLVEADRELSPKPQPAPVAKSLEAHKPQEVARPAEPVKAPDASSVRVETAKLDHLMDMVGEMVIAQSLIRHSQVLLTANDSRLIGDLSQLARVTAEVQRATMSMRMVPVGQLFQKVERIIRDLSRKAGKQIVLETSGIDTEVDKTVAEELSDPLLHMVRNSVDHGVEGTAERVAAGKDAVAKIRLAAYHQGGQVVIEISDDGRGLDAEKIRRKAEQRGLIAPSVQLTEAETYQLIFEPGFSTAEKITDVSGRGVGMDVVRRNVERLRGRIETHSVLGAGTTFQLKLPLTLAIIDGLVVEVGSSRYIIPLSVVREIFRPLQSTLFTVEGRDEMVLVREQLLPVVRLNHRLGIAARAVNACDGLLVVIESESRRFCLLVDDLLGKQEVVIKALGETFKDVTGFSGCAVLGDGRVGLILDTDGLYRGRRR